MGFDEKQLSDFYPWGPMTTIQTIKLNSPSIVLKFDYFKFISRNILFTKNTFYQEIGVIHFVF